MLSQLVWYSKECILAQHYLIFLYFLAFMVSLFTYTFLIYRKWPGVAVLGRVTGYHTEVNQIRFWLTVPKWLFLEKQLWCIYRPHPEDAYHEHQGVSDMPSPHSAPPLSSLRPAMFTGNLEKIPLLEHPGASSLWGSSQYTMAAILHKGRQNPWLLPRASLQLEQGNQPWSGHQPFVENAC